MTCNFYRCTDPDLNMPSMTVGKPDRKTWVKYYNDRPVAVSPGYPEDEVWDYQSSLYVPVTLRMKQLGEQDYGYRT